MREVASPFPVSSAPRKRAGMSTPSHDDSASNADARRTVVWYEIDGSATET